MNAARFLRAAGVVAAIVAYQLAAHHAASTPNAHGLGLALVLAPLLIVSLNGVARSPRRNILLPLWALACVALWLARAPLTAHFGWGLWAEHASFNLALAWMFGRTLATGRVPLCTRFATMVHGKLDAHVVRYTRHVTLAWTLFFVATALISTVLFACAPIVAWSTFANYLALPAVGLMFVAEYACRRIALPHMEPSSIMDAVRAYSQSMQMRRGEAQ